MTLNLNLSSELTERLREEAAQLGLSVDAYTAQLLEKHLPQKNRRAELVNLLQSWMDADDLEEQVETGEFLIRALDQDRPSARKLFPDELRGISW
jgi:hypothetical protein